MAPLGARKLRALLAATLVAGTAAAAIRPASAADLESLRARAQAIADEVSSLEHRRADLEARRQKLETRIVAATKELGLLELQIDDAQTAFEAARAEYVSRAIDIYRAGSDNDLALLLSARDLDELTAIAHATGATTEAAEESLTALLTARDAAEAAQLRVDGRKQALLAAQAEIDVVGDEIDATLASRKTLLKEMTDEIAALEEEARRAARIAAQAGASTGYFVRVPEELLEILAPAGPARGIPEGFVGTGVAFEGVASWYGPGFEGNLTASGDVFDSRLYTAASKELPLRSWLYVEHEGRGVVVLVNDRGPYVGDRILDLSHAAAQAIGITGLGWIRAEVILKTKG